MSKQLLDELEFERNKREILKGTRSIKPEREPQNSLQNETKKFAWEYELENYRKSKMLGKFHTFGAICGILALGLTVLLNFDVLKQFLMKF